MTSEKTTTSKFLWDQIWQGWEPERPELLVRLAHPHQEEQETDGSGELRESLLIV